MSSVQCRGNRNRRRSFFTLRSESKVHSRQDQATFFWPLPLVIISDLTFCYTSRCHRLGICRLVPSRLVPWAWAEITYRLPHAMCLFFSRFVSEFRTAELQPAESICQGNAKKVDFRIRGTSSIRIPALPYVSRHASNNIQQLLLPIQNVGEKKKKVVQVPHR